jgi:hypothetical protein
VSLEAIRLCEGFVTHLAGVGFLTAVAHHVNLEVTRLCKGLVTQLAEVGLIDYYMLFRLLACVKDLLHN